MIIAASLYVAAIASATSVGSPISIGPGAITFDELAGKLSQPDLLVRCDPGVKDRVAFIYLRQRSRDEVESICEKALGAEFVESKDKKSKVWRADREVLRRDTQFASILAESIRSNFERYGRPYQSLTRAIRSDISSDEQARVKGELQHAVARRDRDAVQAAMQRLSELNAEQDAGSAESLICMQLTARMGADSWRRALVRLDVLDHFVQPSVASNTLELIRNDVSPKPDSALTCQLMVTQSDESLGFDLAVSVDNVETHKVFSFAGFQLFPHGNESGHRKPLVAAIFDGTGPVDVFRHTGLGSQARAWLETKRNETARFLESDLARKEVSLGTFPPDSLGQLVAEWCRLTNAEAIIELQPRSESLGTVLRAGAFDKFSWASRVLPQPQWCFDLTDKVLIVTNMLGFLERQAKTPLATLIRCERAMPSQGGKRHVPTVQVLVSAASGERARAIGRFDVHRWSRTYRGFDLEEFDETLDATVLYRALDSVTRAKVSSLGLGEIVSVPFTSLHGDPTAMREVLLYDQGLANAFLLNRALEHRLANHQLVVSSNQHDPVQGPRLKFALDGASMGPRWFGTGTRVEAWLGQRPP